MATTSDYLTQLQQDKQDLVDNLTTQGITGLTGDETFTELVPQVLNIPSGGGTVEVEEKDVNFYDYDGTRVYSYTKNDFLALSSMPVNPSHSGLTAQGWNWDLQEAQDYVTENGILDVGQFYITDDGKTRIYIHLQEERKTPTLGFAVNGTVTIDWGDGTTETVTGTSITGLLSNQHDYPNGGDYIITLDSSSKIYLLGNVNLGSRILCYEENSNGHIDRAYQSAIQKIECGNVNIGSYAFRFCYNLLNITLSNNITSIGEFAFGSCYKILNIVIPSSVTTLNNRAFSGCYAKKYILSNNITSIGEYAFSSCPNMLKIVIPNSITSISSSLCSYSNSLLSLTIPNGVISIGNQAFSRCDSLIKVIIPSSVTSIETQVFSNCLCIKYFDFSSHTSIPTLSNTNAFSSIAFDCKIIVPDNLYSQWVNASQWSGLVTYIISKSDWDASQS